jgi:hypothetical protein
MPKYPITIKQTTVPITSFILLDPNQANKAKTPITIGQGLLTNNFSNQIKKYNKGSKKDSMPSPYALEKSLKLKSIPFFNSRNAVLSITGILLKKSIIIFYWI